ncbi:hypothetical protein DNTS_025947 [Danionella cerebrum]|nr:hypothetical protein DNTS_025947 [Danionella translucida]
MESGFGLEFDGEQLWYVDPSDFQAHQRIPEFTRDWSLDKTLPSQANGSVGTCYYNIPRCTVGEKTPPEAIVPPRTLIYTKREVRLGVHNTLICLMSAFHPPPVNVYWRRNGAAVDVQDVTNTQYYSDGDSTFRLYSYLSFKPEQGDVYSCTVQHKGLQQDTTRLYEVDVLEDSQMLEMVVLVLGILLGFLGFLAGIFFIIKSKQELPAV